jgi:hypothetical protein
MSTNGPMVVPVVPAPYTRPTMNITNVEIRVMNLVLFTNVSVSAVLFEDRNYIDSKQYILSGDDYTNWMNDDSYIVNYVLNQLGLTEASAVQVSTS